MTRSYLKNDDGHHFEAALSGIEAFHSRALLRARPFERTKRFTWVQPEFFLIQAVGLRNPLPVPVGNGVALVNRVTIRVCGDWEGLEIGRHSR